MTVLTIACLILAVTLCISLFYIFKFARIILNIEECVESAILSLDESYNKISNILEKPVFFDSIEVRQTIDEISATRALMLEIAEKLTASLVIENNMKEQLDEENDGR
jgi:hypothetical protein